MSSGSDSSSLDSFFRSVFEYPGGKEWVKDMKVGLGLTASIISTMTFQLALNPPGGVVQASLSDDVRCSNRTGVYMCAGEAVLAVTNKGTYFSFLVSNTISFLASLNVCLSLVAGTTPDHPFYIWLLLVCIWVSITSLALTYLFAASMVTPNSIWPSVVGNGFGITLVVWVSTVVIGSAFDIVRFVRRAIKQIHNEVKQFAIEYRQLITHNGSSRSLIPFLRCLFAYLAGSAQAAQQQDAGDNHQAQQAQPPA